MDICVIQTWLNSSRDYLAGVSLYVTYGTNNFLKNLFQSGPGDYNKKKLAEELQNLVRKVDKMSKLVKESPKLPPVNQQVKYLTLLRNYKEIARRIDRNMSLLDIGSDKHILHETAKQILRLNQTKAETLDKIEFFQKNGYFELPPEKKKRSMDK